MTKFFNIIINISTTGKTFESKYFLTFQTLLLSLPAGFIQLQSYMHSFCHLFSQCSMCLACCE